jgi:hypothetical protein
MSGALFTGAYPTTNLCRPIRCWTKLDQLAAGDTDLIIFDNVMSLMSLIGGSMKDEEAWLATVPLITMLTGKQLWLDPHG